MSNNLTIETIKLALDACDMRQTALSASMANLNNLNYQPVKVNFEEQINRLSDIDNASLTTIHPFFETDERPVSADSVMAESLANVTHYRALIKGLNQQFSIMKIAMHGNNER